VTPITGHEDRVHALTTERATTAAAGVAVPARSRLIVSHRKCRRPILIAVKPFTTREHPSSPQFGSK
jgi:hypothetical protein